MLVVDRLGEAIWVGLDSNSCDVLNKLIETAELTKEEVLSFFPVEQRQEQRLRDLVEQSQAVEMLEDGRLRLRCTVADVLRVLRTQLAADLIRLVNSRAAPAVYRGRIYISPSQRRVNAYICTDELLQGLARDRSLGSLALAIRAEVNRLGRPGTSIGIVTDERKGRGLADCLRDQIADADLHPIPAFSHIDGTPATVAIPWDDPVVVFTDLISSGATVGGLVNRIRGSGAVPLLVACVIDAREAPSDTIQVDSLRIPLVSLVRVNIVPSAEELRKKTTCPINPISERPESEHTQVDYPIPLSEFDKMLVKTNALLYGHIERSGWRHFTIYLDALKLLQENEEGTRDRIIGTFRAIIDEWCRTKNVSQIEELWYPETEQEQQGFASAIEVIAGALGEIFDVKPQPLRRRKGPTQFQFNELPEGPWMPVQQREAADGLLKAHRREAVVYLDWGCLTGQTTRAMLAHAATAAKALVLCFVSQLPFDDEQHLRMITQLSDPAFKFGKVPPTDVTVQFITRLGTWSYSQKECPYCVLQRQHRDDLQIPDYPMWLRKFLESRIADLEAIPLPQAREASQQLPATRMSRRALQLPLALVPDPVETCAAKYVRLARLRENVREAENKTTVREDVRKEILTSLAETPDDVSNPGSLLTGQDLVTLIAHEWTILEHAPLNEPVLRDAIVNKALQLALDAYSLDADRQAAILVLSRVSEEKFVYSIPDLVASVLDKPCLLAQALYSTSLLLRATGSSSGTTLISLSTALQRVSTIIRSRLSQPAGHSDLVSAMEMVVAMATSARYRALTLSTGQLTPVAAWAKLKADLESLADPHHEVSQSFSYLYQTALEEALDRRTDTPEVDWDRILQDWSTYVEPFASAILALLDQLGEVPKGRYIRTTLGESSTNILIEREHRTIQAWLNTIRVVLSEFAQNPAKVQQLDRWMALKEARDCLYSVVFSWNGLHPDQSSALSRMIDGCPFDLASSPLLVERVKRFVESRGGGISFAIDLSEVQLDTARRVFCHEGALERCLEHILSNVIKHRQNPLDGSQEPLHVKFRLQQEESSWALTIMNQSTVPSRRDTKPGGISLCREYLAAYGGEVRIERELESPWTYGVTVTLKEA